MIITDFNEDDPPATLPAARTLERFLISAASAIPLHGMVSVLLTSDGRMRTLNRKYRGKNKPTDVLSFPAAQFAGDEAMAVAGDLAISVDTATRQASALRHTLAIELKILILHGLLHLAGFDHECDQGEMAAREVELRRKFRLPVGLIERAETANEMRVRVPQISKLRAGTSRAVTSSPVHGSSLRKVTSK